MNNADFEYFHLTNLITVFTSAADAHVLAYFSTTFIICVLSCFLQGEFPHFWEFIYYINILSNGYNGDL